MKRPHREQGARRKPKPFKIDLDVIRRRNEEESRRVAEAIRAGKSLSEIIAEGIERTVKR